MSNPPPEAPSSTPQSTTDSTASPSQSRARTFKTWLSYSEDMTAQRDIAGKYGVDIRDPEPSSSSQRALRLLSAAYEVIPETVEENGEQFDYMDNIPEETATQEGACNTAVQRRDQRFSRQPSAPRAVKQESSTENSPARIPLPSGSKRVQSTARGAPKPVSGEQQRTAWVTPKSEPDEDVEMDFPHSSHTHPRRTAHESVSPYSHSSPYSGSDAHSRSSAERSPLTRVSEHASSSPLNQGPGRMQAHAHTHTSKSPTQALRHEFRNRVSLGYAAHSNTTTPELLSPEPAYSTSSGGSSYHPSASSDASSSVTNTPDRKPLETSLARSQERRDWNQWSVQPGGLNRGIEVAREFEFGQEERRGRSMWRNVVPSERYGGSGSSGDDLGYPARYQNRFERSWPTPYAPSLPIRYDRGGRVYTGKSEEGVMSQEYYEQWIKKEQLEG